jgi:hypothetical protein
MSRTYWLTVTLGIALYVGTMIYLGVHNGMGVCQP